MSLSVAFVVAAIFVGLKEPKGSLEPSGRTTSATLAEAQAPFVATVDNEPQWRPDRPPVRWPKFTIDPRAKPPLKRSPAQAIALALKVETHWESFSTGRSKSQPTNADSSEAIGALLAISPDAPEFPNAWAIFIRMRKVDRAISKSPGGLFAPVSLPTIKLGKMDSSYGVLAGSFSIVNSNAFAIYDTEIICDITAPSGTRVGGYHFTIFEIVPATGTKEIKNYKFGLWPDQGKSIGCYGKQAKRRF